MTGLRERKKTSTRRALIEAALNLFEEQGFEATTVQQIADAVMVSRKTFNRYFASKEDVVLAHEEQLMDDWLDVIDARPRHESALTALHRSFREILTGPGRHPDEMNRRLRVQTLLQDNPALMGENMRRFAVREERLARHLAARSPVGLGFDARVLASTAFAAGRVAVQEWAAGPDPDVESSLQLIDRALSRLADLPPHPEPPSPEE
ncbi:TetR/AcrR family transcriptional regulator [Sinosporangium siamense]|uniref:TetR family transcriptional regulator n=1 Tax=Sinosporangium siamense TaxID=1367973 RepID=A0A919RQJ5_9ACTN|nr:TetR family transcriptional regulator [Sinosporangium siamense]GII96399.1 TetR family transcriptional regulator [Sinosporangium siamense]